MSFYSAPFTFDFVTSLIAVDLGTIDVDCASLYSAVKLAQASEEGIVYARIGRASGLEFLGPGVQIGITVELLGNWQLRFANGNYIARVAGGNLTGGPGGDPIAYSPGVQVLLIQSAAATVVNLEGGGAGADPTAVAAAVWSRSLASHATPGTAGKVLATIQNLVRLIPGLF
jgi:hypothetical protein